MEIKYFNRKNNRLTNYDYGISGYYFLTLCTKDKVHLFGKITNGKMVLTEQGRIVQDHLEKLHQIYENVLIDKFVIMPNHLHVILVINNKSDSTISNIVNQYKGAITRLLKQSIWQKSFYNHVIRNEKDYLRIWEYIDTNIIKWESDKYY